MVIDVRRHMPRRRSGHTITVTIGAERFHLTANQREDGSLGEVFLHWGKHGTSTAGLVSTYDWLPYPDRAALGVFTLTERVRRWEQVAGISHARAGSS